MRKVRFSTFVTLVAMMCSHAPANAANSVDVTSFDVAGVKTGMSFEEASAHLADYFKVSPGTLVAGKTVENLVTKTALPNSLEYRKGDAVVRVSFVGRVPADSHRPLVVSNITYRLPFSKENADEMTRLAREKYGEPSTSMDQLPLQWCENPNPNDKLSACRDRKALLMLSGTTLTLYDLQWPISVGKYRQENVAHN